MPRSDNLLHRTLSRITLAEGLTLALFPLSAALYAATGASYGFLFIEAAVGVARLAFLFLPVIIIKLALDFTGVGDRQRNFIYTAYFTALLVLFLFSPLAGYLPEPGEVKRLSSWFIYASMASIIVYGALWSRAFSRERDRHRSVAREHLVTVATMARAAGLLILCYVVHSNLKAAIPLFRVYAWDGAALHLDTLMFFGHQPYELLHNLFPPENSTLFFEQFYFFFFYFNAFGLCGSLVFGSAGYLLRVTNTVVLAYHIGLVAYWLVPTLGPCFFRETAHLFDQMPENMGLKAMLYDGFSRIVTSPARFKTGLFSGIAAFPSLHVSHSLIYLFYLWPRQRTLTAINIVPFILLCVSTVYLGWHYVIDIPAGILVGTAAIVIIRKTYGEEEEV